MKLCMCALRIPTGQNYLIEVVQASRQVGRPLGDLALNTLGEEADGG
jgi:hypothetical protein